MAEQQAKVPSDLMAALEVYLPKMNFYRFCQLLEQLYPENSLGCSESPQHDALRFAPSPSMSFPAGELKCIERHPYLPRPPTVRTTFLGLYGVDSMLPYALLDDIIKRQEGYDVLMDFLDIFNHRILTHYYRIWLKYHYPASYLPAGRDSISCCLLSLIGIGITGTDKVIGTPSSRFLSMLGIVTQKTRTAEGVCGVIKIIVPDIEVEVTEFHPVWVTLDAPTALCRHSRVRLGKSSVLGRRFCDANQTIKIILIAKTAAVIEKILPDGQGYRDIMMLLRLYLGYRVEAQLYMRLDKQFLPKPRLSQRNVRLGQTARLSSRRGHPDTGFVMASIGQYRGLNS